MELIIALKSRRANINKWDEQKLADNPGNSVIEERYIHIQSVLSLPEQIALTQLALTGLVNVYEKELIK